jgi:poly(A) polymerase
VIALLEGAGIRAIPTGIDHGTVTAVIGAAHFEITTLRTDVETFGRRARVAFTDDWTADAARRDFTINALSCRPDGAIFDPFDGLADLGAGRVRFVGDPLRRIDEDVLRLLRFFRFYAHYGQPPTDVAALAACRTLASRLASLSGERISGELIKLLQAHDPASVLLLMKDERVLSHVLPEAADFGRLRILSFLEERGVVRPTIQVDAIRRLAAVLPADAEGAAVVASRLRLSNSQSDRLIALATPDQRPDPAMDGPAARRLLHRIGAERFRDLILLAWAARKAEVGRSPPGETARWLALLDHADAWQPVALPVRGQDVVDLGVPRGPQVGAVLADLEAWWQDNDFQAGRKEAMEHLRKLLKAPSG